MGSKCCVLCGACFTHYKYFGDNNRRCSRKKEYETYQINKIQVNIFNVKCLGDIATRRNQRNNWMLENSKKDKEVNQAEPLLPYSSRFTATSSKFKNLNHDFLIFLYFFP
ncbi:hypothetical protein L3Y34_009695 [Caenorhabditis briggsae]|uniref:Uncharacterized protein n=1 Tax=Caenorhabditis briggsae TaxID=6238 RepID=A0AAE9ACQ2_CAEBR|nr:hypothetical protein L3Y34_009695 [Caenorhabditis briggsae]